MESAFFGSPRFAAIVLEKLIEGGFAPSLVVCNPDRPVGRKQVMTAPPVKSLITNNQSLINNVEILQPERSEIRNLKFEIGEVDFAIVAAYAQIIPKSVLALPRLGTIGVHPSLLPRHRGATPIQSAILEGDKETGTTLFLMDDKVDHGPILAQAKYELGVINYESLEEKLAKLSGDLLTKTLPEFLAGKIKTREQDHAKATFTKKFETQDAFIEEKDLAAAEAGDKKLAIEIDRKIRALNPEPGAWIMRDGKRIKLLEAEIKNGKLVLKKTQIEGKKPQNV